MRENNKMTYIWTEKASQHSNDPRTAIQDQSKCLQSIKGHRRTMNPRKFPITKDKKMGICKYSAFKPLIFSLAPSLPYYSAIACSKNARLPIKIVSVGSLPSVRRNS